MARSKLEHESGEIRQEVQRPVENCCVALQTTATSKSTVVNYIQISRNTYRLQIVSQPESKISFLLDCLADNLNKLWQPN